MAVWLLRLFTSIQDYNVLKRVSKNFTGTYWQLEFSIWWLKKKFQPPLGTWIKELILDPAPTNYLETLMTPLLSQGSTSPLPPLMI